jgi:NAD(P)-dependent dehydrogenase (short-subunit alcohol dehydrogenase family)
MLKCFDLTGKTAIVTGGNRGLGRAMAEGLAESGADIFLIATNASSLKEAAESIGMKYGIKCNWAVADITEEEQVIIAVNQCMQSFGKVDILLNNAATDRVPESPEEASLEKWRRVIDINVNGPFIVAKTVGKHMISARQGKIINMASVCGYILNTIVKAGSYDVSKHAIVAMTRALAVEWSRYNIQVNAIAPGYFMTEPNRQACDDVPGLEENIAAGVLMKRWGKPEELKGIAVLLASSASDYMTGSVLFCDGGVTII